MSIYYNKDVNDFMEYSQNSKKISINDIYSQVYNVNSATAIKMANDYLNKQNTEKRED